MSPYSSRFTFAIIHCNKTKSLHGNMESTGTFPAVPRGKHTFTYTNTCFDSPSLVIFTTHMRSTIGEGTRIFISDSWAFKRTFDDSKFEFTHVTDWERAVFFNFTMSELDHYMQYVRHVAANYLDADNIALALDSRLQTYFDNRRPLSDIQKYTEPYNVIGTKIKDKTEYRADQMNVVRHQTPLVMANFHSQPKFEAAALKHALLHFWPLNNAFLFVMTTQKVHSLVAELVREQRMYQMLFSCFQNVYINTPCDLVLEYPLEKRIELELFQQKRRARSKKWVSYPHRLFEFSESGVYISVGEMAGCPLSHNLLTSLEDFIIL